MVRVRERETETNRQRLVEGVRQTEPDGQRKDATDRKSFTDRQRLVEGDRKTVTS